MTEAIFENGTLRPVTPLDLKEHDRVHLVVSSPAKPAKRMTREERARILQESSDRLGFRSEGPYPTREEIWSERFQK